MTRTLIAITLLFASMPTHHAGAADPPAPAAEKILVRKCLIDYERSAQVGAISQGPNSFLQECLVKLGDRVKAGQVLGRLQNKDIEAELLHRRAEAENIIGISISENKHKQAVFELQRAERLVNKNVNAAMSITPFKLGAEAAALEIERARYARTLAQYQLKEIEAQYRNRDFTSPIDGIVSEVFKQQGERVSIADPVFLVVDDTSLLVTGHLDVVDAWRVQRGHRARVVAEVDGADLPIENEEFIGQVIFVDGRIDPSTRTCKVVARISNRDSLLRSGLEARMEIELGPELAEATKKR